MECINRILLILASIISILISLSVIVFGVSIGWLAIPLLVRFLLSCMTILVGIGFGVIMIVLVVLAW